jgi:hypothetical protein
LAITATVVAVGAAATLLAPGVAVAVAGGGAITLGVGGSAGAAYVALGAVGVAVGTSLMADSAARKKNSGKTYPSRRAATRAARRDARENPRACYRPECGSGDHVHVDKKNGKGTVVETWHYRW